MVMNLTKGVNIINILQEALAQLNFSVSKLDFAKFWEVF